MSRTVLVVSNDHIGRKMVGPGIRSYEFARELAKRFEVTLVVPYETDLEAEGIEIVQARPDDDARLTELARGFDVVVAQRLPVRTMASLAGTATRTIYDLYAPVVLENLALDARRERSRRLDLHFRTNSLIQEVALATGNAFICASERQRDLWLGSLAAIGRLDQERYREDPALRSLIDVVPFGIDPDPPRSSGSVLRGVVPGIGETDKVLLWPGGIWEWFDPLTVIRAVHELSRRRDDIRLYFLGLKHPSPEAGEMAMTGRAVELAEELGLRDRVVFFNFDWVPYAERGSYLLEADLGVSAHFDDLETRFSFRTRLLDCFWAGLPVVVTGGDALGELVAERELGRVVGFEDADGWAAAIDELLGDAKTYRRLRTNVEAVRQEFAWPRVVEVLARLVAVPGTPVKSSARVKLAVAEYLWVRVRLARLRRGVLGTAARLLQLAAARARRRLRRSGQARGREMVR